MESIKKVYEKNKWIEMLVIAICVCGTGFEIIADISRIYSVIVAVAIFILGYIPLALCLMCRIDTEEVEREEQDERNQMIRGKSALITQTIMLLVYGVVIIVGLSINSIAVSIVGGILFVISTVILMVAFKYYGNKY